MHGDLNTGVDPLTSLAFSVWSNAGVYAVLLGSGVSRAAGIPTGWEVTLDLARKLAQAEEDDCGESPEEWYRGRYGGDLDYSQLLAALAQSSSERAQLLRSYFEPTEEEREMSKKSPTPAHKAIAELVALGYIRVILTTNFDRLMEQALETAGLPPAVISSPDAAEGALPLAHSRCTLVKVNGDYLDTRIKNTEAELSLYDERTLGLLDQVFDEYGLIVCGWSGDYDHALRATMQRCKSRRFTTYWCAHQGRLSEQAKGLVSHRRAVNLSIDSADDFFDALKEKVLALRAVPRPHPVSAKVAVATVKRYLPDDRYLVRLHDLLVQETEAVNGTLGSEMSPLGATPNRSEKLRRVELYEARSEVLLAMMAVGGYWGREVHDSVWTKCVARLAAPDVVAYGATDLIRLLRYPALLACYALGIGAVAAGNYRLLRVLLKDTSARRVETNETSPLLSALVMPAVLNDGVLADDQRWSTPLSHRVGGLLRPHFLDSIPSEAAYLDVYSRFEYLWNLELFRETGSIGFGGEYYWRRFHDVADSMRDELNAQQLSWPPFAAGFIGGDLNAARIAVVDAPKQMQDHRRRLNPLCD